MRGILASLLIMLSSVSAMAQLDVISGPRGGLELERDLNRGRINDRERERLERERAERDRRGGHVYGPARTYQWMYFGKFKAPKLVKDKVTIDVRNRFVNEILLESSKNGVEVVSAKAYLVNGQVIDLPRATGVFRERARSQSSLDRRNSLRVDRIVLEITSRDLTGSRGELAVFLGLAE